MASLADPKLYQNAVVVILLIYTVVPFLVLVAALRRYQLRARAVAEAAASADAAKTKMSPNFSASSDVVVPAGGPSSAAARSVGMPAPPPVTLTFRNVMWSVEVKRPKDDPNPGKGKTKVKKIIKGVTGFIESKKLTAIMGPSGCGKSTLLDILADRKPGAPPEGTILVNGEKIGPSYRRVAAYVMQSDVLFPRLTVRETLMYAAQLRVPASVPLAEKTARVDQILRDLELAHVADTVIGDERLRGLSGGQRRRVTVGVELVTNPSLIFLDEPTSGLDAYNSLVLVNVLRRLADAGRAVVCTIHQPRPDIFNLFDNLLLMKAGNIVYLGPADRKMDPRASMAPLVAPPPPAALAMDTGAAGAGIKAPPVWPPGNLRDYFKAIDRPLDDTADIADVVVDMTAQKEEGDDEDWWLLVDMDDEDDDFGDVIESPPGAADVDASMVAQAGSPVDESNVSVAAGASVGAGGSTPLSSSFSAIDSNEFNPAEVPAIIVNTNEGAAPPVRFAAEMPRRRSNAPAPRQSQDPLLRSWEGSAWKEAIDIHVDALNTAALAEKERARVAEGTSGKESLEEEGRYANSLVEQIVVLLHRSVVNLKRQRSRLLQSYAINIANFLFLGIVFLGLRVPPYNDQSSLVLLRANSAFIFLVTQYAVLSELDTIGDAFLEKNIFLRESASLSYSCRAYHAAWFIKLFSFALIKGLPFTLICYFLSGMGISAAEFFYFAAVMTVLSTLGSALALLLVSLVPSVEGSASTFSSIIGMFETTAGYYLSPGLIPYWDTPLYFLSPITYVLQGIYWSQFYGQSVDDDGTTETALDYFEVMKNLNQWANLLIVMAYAPVLHAIALACTYLITQGADTRHRIRESKTAASFRRFVDGLRRQHRLVSVYMQEHLNVRHVF